MWQTCVVLAALASVGVLGSASVGYPSFNRGQSRILSGWQASEGQFPFVVCLRSITAGHLHTAGQVEGCGASLLHHEWALTAAHCVASMSHIIIRVGTLNVSRPFLVFDSSEYYTHPQFNDMTPGIVQPHDIGLIKFPFPVEYNHLIQPVRIQRSQDKNRNYFGQQMIAAGWGLLWTRGTFPDVLNWVYLRGETNEKCLEEMISINAGHVVVDSTICTRGWYDPTQSTCQGDSGGPLMIVEEDGQPTVIGLTSFIAAIGCHAGLPAGFVRPGFYHEFITDVTGINFDW